MRRELQARDIIGHTIREFRLSPWDESGPLVEDRVQRQTNAYARMKFRRGLVELDEGTIIDIGEFDLTGEAPVVGLLRMPDELDPEEWEDIGCVRGKKIVEVVLRFQPLSVGMLLENGFVLYSMRYSPWESGPVLEHLSQYDLEKERFLTYWGRVPLPKVFLDSLLVKPKTPGDLAEEMRSKWGPVLRIVPFVLMLTGAIYFCMMLLGLLGRPDEGVAIIGLYALIAIAVVSLMLWRAIYFRW